MTNPSPFETQVAALISAYADRAPVDIDPVAMTRLAAAAPRGRAIVLPGLGASSLRLGFALLVVALLVAIVGTVLMAGARPLLRDREVDLAERGFVEPFVGLPPAGAMPSVPESGELVFSFVGRVHSLKLDVYRMWVYADGRLIWKSNLEGSGRESLAFGPSGPTLAVIEQRLTPLGVQLLRSEVTATAHILGPARVGEYLVKRGGPGVLWGGMAIGSGDRILGATWDDPQLPARLANPASWLPASAWADQRVGGFVPARYAVCVRLDGDASIAPSELVEQLPERTRDLLLSRSMPLADPLRSDCRDTVATDDAHAIVETLDAAGLRRDGSDQLIFTFGIRGILELLPILPNGDMVCNCG